MHVSRQILQRSDRVPNLVYDLMEVNYDPTFPDAADLFLIRDS